MRRGKHVASGWSNSLDLDSQKDGLLPRTDRTAVSRRQPLSLAVQKPILLHSASLLPSSPL